MSQKMKIITGYEDKLDQVKIEIISQKADFTHSRHVYPNGLTIEFKTSSEGIEVSCNKTLQEITPGVYKPII